MSDRYMALLAFVATLIAIVVLALAGTVVVATADLGTDKGMAQLIGALSFVATAITGLVAVASTFRPKGSTEKGERG